MYVHDLLSVNKAQEQGTEKKPVSCILVSFQAVYNATPGQHYNGVLIYCKEMY